MSILFILQIIIPCLLILFILLQQRGQALGSAFGGESGSWARRRGAEKKFFWATVMLGALFVGLSLLNLLLAG